MTAVAHQPMPVSVELFGVSERTRKALEVLFFMQGKGRYRLAANEAPQVAIVDMDGPDAAKLWDDYRFHYPALFTIVVSFRDEEHPEAAVALKKPLVPESLLAALAAFSHAVPAPQPASEKGVVAPADILAEQADERRPGRPDSAEGHKPEQVLHFGKTTHAATSALEDAEEDSEACGAADDIDLNDPKQWHTIYYNPEHHFLSVCRQAMHLAIQTGKIQRLALDWLAHPLYFLPDHGGQIITLLSRERMRFFCLVLLTDIANSIVPLQELPPDLVQSPRIPFARFLWEITLWTSRGHLPEGTSVDVPLRLKYWPNFTRLMETPHAMRIAALWSRQPYSMLRTCQILGVPQRYIFAFYGAANSADLIEWKHDHDESNAPLLGIERKGEQDRRQNTERRAHGDRRGLIGRILSHLQHIR